MQLPPVATESSPVPTLRDLGFFEVEEVAAIVRTKTLTLRNWRTKKIGPPFTKVHGNRIVYPIDGLKQWLQDRTVQAPAAAAPTLIDGNKRRTARA